ncbi:superfamily I DNA/RNA helicase [Paenibacillus mucilaginosus]|uniref:UvrD-helicase domain-containing protein n=1 Tax=Paenibacillus mucilaginosus TaxID=61624 RepID=UPI003D1F9528
MEDSAELRREIAELPVSESVVVAAGPGSGKTKLLIDRLIYLSQNPIRNNSNIACITYTNAAKDEILHRLQNEDRFSLPQGTFIGTIHSFLNEFLIAPYSYLLSPDGQAYELLPQGFSKAYVGRVSRAEKFKYKDNVVALESIGYDRNGNHICYRSNVITKEEMHSLKYLIHNDHKIDQQDTIYFAYQLLLKFPHLKNALTARFYSVLVDEYQDVTYYQDQIFQLLNKTSMFFVGDPNQSIFSFTGAEPVIFESRLSNPELFKKYTLTHNFRSTDDIIKFNNKKSSFEQIAMGSNKNVQQEVTFLWDKVDIKEAIEAFHEVRLNVEIEKEHVPFLILSRRHDLLTEIQIKVNGSELEQSPFLKKLKENDYRRYEILKNLLTALKVQDVGKSLESIELALSRIIFNKSQNFITLSEIKYDRMLWRKLQVVVFTWLKNLDTESITAEDFLKELKGQLKNYSEKTFGIKIGIKLKCLDYEWTNQKRDSKKVTLKKIMDQIIVDSTEPESYLSTIHSAKGREATSILVIAKDLKELKSWHEMNVSEEARVGFVAFTRARRLLCVWCPGLKVDVLDGNLREGHKNQSVLHA